MQWHRQKPAAVSIQLVSSAREDQRILKNEGTNTTAQVSIQLVSSAREDLLRYGHLNKSLRTRVSIQLVSSAREDWKMHISGVHI